MGIAAHAGTLESKGRAYTKDKEKTHSMCGCTRKLLSGSDLHGHGHLAGCPPIWARSRGSTTAAAPTSRPRSTDMHRGEPQYQICRACQSQRVPGIGHHVVPAKDPRREDLLQGLLATSHSLQRPTKADPARSLAEIPRGK